MKDSAQGEDWVRRAIEIRRRGRDNGIEELFTADDVEHVFKMFGFRCFACGDKADLEVDHHKDFKSKNPLTRENAVLLCKWCNRLKGNLAPEEFYSPSQLEELSEFYGIR